MTTTYLAPIALPAGSTAPTPAANDASTALATTEYADRAVMSEVVAITGTTQTLGAAHLGKWLDCENAAAQVISIDNDANAAWPANAQSQGMQMGVGRVSFVGVSPVVIRHRDTFSPACAGQYAPWGIKRVGANEWALFGDLEPA